MSSIDVCSEEKKKSEIVLKSTISLRSFFSYLYTRLCILCLLGLDAIWLVFLLGKVAVYGVLQIVCLGSSATLQAGLMKGCASIRRALVCGLCLLISLLSPALGIMVGCAYFLMYDKSGVEEIVPSILKKQFGELLSLHKEKNQGLGL